MGIYERATIVAILAITIRCPIAAASNTIRTTIVAIIVIIIAVFSLITIALVTIRGAGARFDTVTIVIDVSVSV